MGQTRGQLPLSYPIEQRNAGDSPAYLPPEGLRPRPASPGAESGPIQPEGQNSSHSIPRAWLKKLLYWNCAKTLPAGRMPM